MTARGTALAFLFLALAAGVTLWGGVVAPNERETYRLALVWGIPAALLAFSLLLFPRPPKLDRAGRVGSALRLSPWLAAVFLLDLAGIAAGYGLGWATLTYGDQALEAAKLTTPLWALPLCLLAGIAGWEWGLRRTLFAAWRASGGKGLALAAAVACGTALALPGIAPGFEVPDRAFVLAALATALAREIELTLIFRALGLAAAGALRGLYLFADAFLLSDWYSAYFPTANYVSSDPRFYLLRGGTSVLALLVLVAGLARQRRIR